MSQSKKLQEDLSKFVDSLTKKNNMAKIAKEGASIVKRRTRTAGRDVFDKPLKPLAEGTVRQKRKKGRPQPKKSRLTDSGAMLDSLDGKAVADGKGIVYLKDSEEIKKASWNEKLGRIFFGISNKDERKLSNFIKDLLRKTGRI